MEQHIIEIAPEQVVRWLKAEIAARPDAFDIMTERDFIVAEIGNPEAVGIDDETDIGEGAAIGLMEIRPMHPPKDWVLRVRAEDELAEHVPLDHSVWDTPEEIDLQTFEDPLWCRGGPQSM
jgi:hypothetical protein